MKALRTDAAAIEAAFATVTDWDAWAAFEAEFFDWGTAPERSADAMARDLARSPVTVGGRTWRPCAANYAVPPEVEHLYGRLRAEIFERLEPDAHRCNLSRPERYGSRCVACRVFARDAAARCPFCGGPLLAMPLFDD